MVGKKPTEVKEGDIWRVERPSFLVINITEGIATPLKVLLDPFFGENRWQFTQIPIGILHT
jgi:hypothetical protein